MLPALRETRESLKGNREGEKELEERKKEEEKEKGLLPKQNREK